MARIRTIKPEFCTSEQVVDCSPTARLLFVSLWCFCDDRGVHPDSPKRIKMEVFPADAFTVPEITAMVDELVGVGLLARFDADGAAYLHVTGWDRHQKVDRPTVRFPAPPRRGEIAKFDEASASPRHPLDEASTSARGGLDEPSPPEGKGKEKLASKPAATISNREENDRTPTPASTPTRLAENPVTVGRSALKVVGWDHEAYEAGARTYASVGRWLGQGFTPDEIVAVFRRRTDIATARNPIAYAAKLMADEVQAMRAQTEADTKPLARTWGGKTEDEWRTRIEIGARAGWSDCWGFPPDDAGTLCPAHLRPEWEAALARGQAA